MSRPSEYWSEEHAHSSGKPDANLATNALQLGGIDAEDYATKKYVQDFHNNKEELLKEYIDSQDLAKLQEAKDYVDTMIRNQDFSTFAKLTDLQTLSQTLSERIEACKTQCQTELNNRINAVVSDVNENFDDVNGAISQLNTKTNELFTSVSNGKELVADAITDKGIHTSANDSYNTMARNIRALDTSGEGGDYDENFVNTADGNATEEDLMLGKIAYSRGQKIIGTHVDSGSGGDSGIDTSDATAYSSDLRYGTTAYARGQKITGTLIPESGGGGEYIEKIYGTDENSLDTYTMNADSSTLYEPAAYIYDESLRKPVYVIAKCINQTIDTYSVLGENLYNKRSFTFAQLGIKDAYGNIAKRIDGIYATHLRQSYPYVAVVAGDSDGGKTVVNILRYDTDEDGLYFERNCAIVSSKITENCYINYKEIAISPDGNKLVETLTGVENSYASPNTRACIDIYRIYPATPDLMYVGRVETVGHTFLPQFINDRLIYVNKKYYSAGIIIVLDNEGNILKSTTISNCVGVSSDGNYLLKVNTSNGLAIDIIKININYDTGDITQSSTNTVSIQREGIGTGLEDFAGLLFSDSNIFLFSFYTSSNNTSTYETYSVNFEEKTLTLIDSQVGDSYSSDKKIIPIHSSKTKVSQDNNFVNTYKRYMTIGTNMDKVVGVKYNGNTFYRKGY